MKIISARNVHEAFPLGLRLLRSPEMFRRESRNGPVIVAPYPVTTVYERPIERVLFWPLRDCNPFFHIYEALWMLAGRNDVAGPSRYAKNMANYSDDSETFHGAYGYRWRHHPDFSVTGAFDQLSPIANTLKQNPDDRRSVLQMWNAYQDLGKLGKDLPCNLTATFQRDAEGKLDLTVFCRSNDIIWGAYGANAVHFSMLLEYMALWIGCPIGNYYQVSVNWHAYTEVLKKFDEWNPNLDPYTNPYIKGVQPIPMADWSHAGGTETIGDLDYQIRTLLHYADTDTLCDTTPPKKENAPWMFHVRAV